MLNQYKMEKIARGLIYALAFVPFLIVPYTLWPLVFIPNIIFYCLTAILLFLAMVVAHKDRHNLKFFTNPLFWFLGLFAVSNLISAFFGVDFINSFFGFQARMGGALAYIALFSWVIILLVFLNTKERWEKFFRLSAIAAGAVLLVSILHSFLPNGLIIPNTYHGNWFKQELSGILGNPIFFAGYLLPNIFFSFLFALRAKVFKVKVFWLILSLFLIFGLFMTHSKGGWLAFAGALFVLGIIFIAHYIKTKNKKLSPIVLLGAPFSAILGFLLININFFNKIAGKIISGTGATRLITWKIGLLSFFDKWLFGWGPENYIYGFSKFYNPRLLRYSFYETWSDKPHNQFIEMFANLGIVGGILFLAIFICTLYMLFKLYKKDTDNKWMYVLLGGGLLAYMAHIFFAFDTYELRIIIFALLGYIIFLYNSTFDIDKKLAFSKLKWIIGSLLIIVVISLYAIGIQTVKASFYASRIVDGTRNNNYQSVVKNIHKLAKIKGPYQNRNWEYLADIVLKADAVRVMPVTILKKILPVLKNGMKSAYESKPNNFSYAYRLAQMYSLAGRHIDYKYTDKSLEMAEKALQISPDRQVTYILLGQIYFEKRDLEKGIEVVRKAIEKSPDVADTYWFLGLLYNANEEYKKAYYCITTAFEMGRGFGRNNNERNLFIKLLARFDDYERMFKIYNGMVLEEPDRAHWWAGLAAVSLELEKFDKAIESARQAMFLDSSFADEAEAFIKTAEEMKEKSQ